MRTQDSIVSIYPYFKVSDGKLDDFKTLCERFLAATRQEPKCVYYGFSFHENDVHCREGYEGAEGLLTHLSNVGPILAEALKIAQLTRLEIHGAAEELAKLKDPLSNLQPTYFTLEYGFRRSVESDPTSTTA